MKPIFVFTGEYDSNSSRVNDLDSYYDTFSLYSETCPFCNIACVTGKYETAIMDAPGELQIDRLSICKRCGWWSYDNDDPNPYMVSFWSMCAILKQCNVSDLDAPINELSRYLEENADGISKVHPAKFEELVGSVFSSYFGYQLEFCSYGRPDLGIDLVVLNTDDDTPIAIQVKRYKNPIELGQIHQFFGALVDSNHRQGVFVTSGKFRSGAVATAGRLSANSEIKIDLMDGKRFLEFLKVVNSKSKSVYDNVLEYLERTNKRFQTIKIIKDLKRRSYR